MLKTDLRNWELKRDVGDATNLSDYQKGAVKMRFVTEPGHCITAIIRWIETN